MLKGLELKSACQFFGTTVQNVKITRACCIRACIKLCSVCQEKEGWVFVFMQNCYVWLIFATLVNLNLIMHKY